MRRLPTRVVHTVAIAPNGALKVVVVSDTHARPAADSLKHIAAEAPDLILHAGDVGAGRVLDHLRTLAPTLTVRGNIDSTDTGWPDEAVVHLQQSGVRVATWFVTHIALYGARLLRAVAERAQAEGAQMVVCGHSHMPMLSKDKGLVAFNPGSIGPRRFGLPLTYGVVELNAGRYGFRHVDGLTGKRWLPPGAK